MIKFGVDISKKGDTSIYGEILGTYATKEEAMAAGKEFYKKYGTQGLISVFNANVENNKIIGKYKLLHCYKY